MTFPYQVVKGIDDRTFKIYEKVLPWLKVTVFNPDNPEKGVSVFCLADTGSDLTFFTSEIGIYLGYEIQNGKKVKLNGIGGGVQEASFFERVGIRIGNLEFIGMMGFISDGFPLFSPQQTGILGTTGFFRNANVCFSYPTEMKVTANLNLN